MPMDLFQVDPPDASSWAYSHGEEPTMSVENRRAAFLCFGFKRSFHDDRNHVGERNCHLQFRHVKEELLLVMRQEYRY